MKMNNCSAEYTAAYDKSALAIKAFNEITKAYRARLIGDNEFINARKIYDAAMAEYDLAYAKEDKLNSTDEA